MVDYHPLKAELAEQLAAWWVKQTDFKTKRALAAELKIHPDTLGDYFSGRKFPRSDIASGLYGLTRIMCLKPQAGGDLSLEMGTPESSTVPLPPPPAGIGASLEKPQGPDTGGVPDVLKEGSRSGESAEVMAAQPPGELLKKGERYEEKSAVISLQHTTCPFCGHGIAQFRSCVYCGQHLVWANVPMEHDEPKE